MAGQEVNPSIAVEPEGGVCSIAGFGQHRCVLETCCSKNLLQYSDRRIGAPHDSSPYKTGAGGPRNILYDSRVCIEQDGHFGFEQFWAGKLLQFVAMEGERFGLGLT